MLLSFRFANHRSFRDEQQLNLTPAYRDGDPGPAVRVAGIFGANASGKSNCLDALAFMRRFVIFSDREVEPGLGVAREPYRMTAESLDAPSHYVVDLSLNGVRHTYGFALDNDGVVNEWLYHYPLKRRRRVFERNGDTFAWGEDSNQRVLLERIAEVTASTALFVSTIARFDHRQAAPDEPGSEPLRAVYRWFQRMSTRSQPQVGGSYRSGWPQSDASRRTLVELLRAADVGIVDVVEVTSTVTEEQPTLFRPSDLGPEPGNERRMLRNERAHGRASRERKRLKFAHQGPAGEVQFELDEESTGTQHLLGLAIEAADVLSQGGTMCVDEIDASLHPLLTAKLIGLFQSTASNPRHSQLIFTSHDAALLGTIDTEEILHRDEIWFTEKAADGASTLYPLTDFKPRKEGENRQRRYLNGNYGAIPDLSTYLFEQALAARGPVDGEATD
ncbi:ATP-binding protein [Micromonospora sp. ALFpr18c]|uniref:AAA family ATPase n=1 Tax=unclassified Micromonospora TaxID=2617518 RepID=UPI00124B79B6|nr:ATP-binding protein [Micromonospora sp. ALFpr18c]KAB1940528.1 ATP-binding protein [Micromonospora sp. ALFpr18c]